MGRDSFGPKKVGAGAGQTRNGEGSRLKRVNRNQLLLRTVDVEKLVEPDHLVRAIWELSGGAAARTGAGRAAGKRLQRQQQTHGQRPLARRAGEMANDVARCPETGAAVEADHWGPLNMPHLAVGFRLALV